MKTMWDDFEIYQRNFYRENRESKAVISIYKNGRLSFNRKFIKDNNLNKYNYVKLAYSKKNNVIAIQFLHKQEGDNLLKLNPDNSCSLLGFINIYKLDKAKIIKKYYPILMTINGAEYFVIYLNNN